MPNLTHPFSINSAWNTPIDPAHITYTNPVSPENRDFRDQSKAFLINSSLLGGVAVTPLGTTVHVLHYNNCSVDVDPNGVPNGTVSVPVPNNITTNTTTEWTVWTDLDGIHVWEGW